ncbi:MAG: threonine ammonia-lyase, biosynthetic, partial [Betaproteobacteria bacterium]|nr:threonine ammonia-lyase, biosynthetic [Betaproteobacteria bacterium]
DEYLKKILAARVYDVAIESPLERGAAMSEELNNRVLLKREDLQPVFSFKIRGAYNKMAHLTPAELKHGVICASAGNHAQGVALAAQKLGCKATIVMPVTTPKIKIDAVARRGATVLLKGDSYHEASQFAQALSKSKKLCYVHPYDDPLVIAGQGTIGMEILRQHQHPIDAVFVPVGGGGLIAGIAAYIKALSPSTKIIGVEPVDSNAMYQSLKAGKRVTLSHVNLFADGVAVKQVGAETFRLARQLVDEVVLVDTDEICAAIKDIFQDTRSIMEPSGGLALAGIKRYVEREKCKGRTFVAICCGANMNFDRLRFVAERAEVGEHHEALLAVTVPEARGSFRRFCELIGPRNVTEFNYRIADAKVAHLFVGVQIRSREEAKKLVAHFGRNGFKTLDLSDDEMAKLHVRHLVGGRSPLAQEERIYRFEFPEKPGALMNFLTSMSPNWNISLFHYRNHGADVGRILVGLQVPKGEAAAFNRFLKKLGYEYVDETRNPAYRLFLG